MLEWLLAPIDPMRVHEVGSMMAWHGRLMVIGWGIMIPLGIVIARFFKVTRQQNWPNELDNRFWWRSHLLLQSVGYGLSLIGLWLIWNADLHPDQTGIHYLFGWAILLAGAFQITGGLLRGSKGGPTAIDFDRNSLRGDHYDMTPRRVLFERQHKLTGYAAILLSVAAILTGMWQANAPRWFFIGMGGWWCTLALAFGYLQKSGLALDTYQAIWGPGLEHPGNHRPPIGPGIKRVADDAITTRES